MYNPLKYVKILEETGIPRNQAEAQIQIMTEVIDTNLATKQDMKDLIVATKQDMKDFIVATKQDMKDFIVATDHNMSVFRKEMNQDMINFKTEIRQDFKELITSLENTIVQSEYKLTIRLGAMTSVIVGLALAAAKFL